MIYLRVSRKHTAFQQYQRTNNSAVFYDPRSVEMPYNLCIAGSVYGDIFLKVPSIQFAKKLLLLSKVMLDEQFFEFVEINREQFENFIYNRSQATIDRVSMKAFIKARVLNSQNIALCYRDGNTAVSYNEEFI